MFYQEVTIAETPEYGDTRQSTILSRLEIHIAIAHIDSPLLPYSKLLQGGKDRIRRGFLSDTLSLVFPNSHLDGVREEMLAEFLCGSHHLVAHHSQTTAFRL